MTQANSETNEGDQKLRKELGLWDVYCIATGAMFSSGFFLLPGLAAARAGPSAVVAYIAAGLLMVPSMLSMLELATALPRAGGAYYFLDRSLGPAVGTVTGLGTWLALAVKSAFALVGMGAYLAITPGLAQWLSHGSAASAWLMKALAAGLTVLFAAVNILGARRSAIIQKLFVIAILAVLGLFIAQGLWHVSARMPNGRLAEQYSPFLHPTHGLHGLLSTIGLVFVSYAGLTKVAGISEEVRRPERNLPLGVCLSLGTATAIYAVGVFVMVAVLDPRQLRADYAPVATAAQAFFDWPPGMAGTLLIVIAALAAFASTANAGLLAASRYPMAMARDKLLWPRLAETGRFRTPTPAILLTAGAMVIFILALSTEQVAKFGSTFNLLIFGLVNLAVIVMRESRIVSYDPGFRTPLYPWTPLAGALISGWLIVEMGWVTALLTLGVIVAGILWYGHYGRPRVQRYGAVHHVFARLGQYRHPGLREEFREIIKEKGLRAEDPYDEIIRRAPFLDVEDGDKLEDALRRAAEKLTDRVQLRKERIVQRLTNTGRYGGAPLSHGAALLHFRTRRTEHSEMALIRAVNGLCIELPPDDESEGQQRSCNVYAVFVLISPEGRSGQHLRILAELAERVENETFMDTWRRIKSSERLKESLLRDARFLELFIGADEATRPLMRRKLAELDLPPGAFVAMIRRSGKSFEPRGRTVLRQDDHVTFIGEPEAIEQLYEKYVAPKEK